jgi:hypothetical protein
MLCTLLVIRVRERTSVSPTNDNGAGGREGRGGGVPDA